MSDSPPDIPGSDYMPFRLRGVPSLRFRRSHHGALWAPERLGESEPQTGMAFYSRAYVSYSDVHGEVPTLTDAVQRLQRYDLRSILNTLGEISSATHNARDEALLGVQLGLGRRMFEQQFRPVVQTMVRMTREAREHDSRLIPSAVLFHELQLINVAKLAVAEVAVDQPLKAEGPEDLANALLIVNDLIGAPDTLNRPPSSAETEEDRRAWERFFLVNGYFHHYGHPLPSLSRSWELYLTDRPHLRDSPVYEHFPNLVEEITGLSPLQVWARCFAVYSHWGKGPDSSSGALPSPVSRSTHFTSEFKFEPEEEDAFWSLVSAAPEELRAELKEAPEECRSGLDPYSNLPFEKRPLVRVGDQIFCPSVTLMLRRMTSGLHHLFLNRISEAERRHQYLVYMGEVFEDYVLEVLERAFGSSGRLIREDELQEMSPPGSPVCDAVVTYPEAALLIEIKAKRLPLEARVRGDMEVFDNVFDDVFVDAAKQVDAIVGLIEGGALADSGLLSSRIRRYVAASVTLDPIPMNPYTYDRLSQKVDDEGLLQHPKIEPLQLLAAEDVEIFEVAAKRGRSVIDLLSDRTAAGAHRYASLLNHLSTQDDPLLEAPHPRLQVRLSELTQSAVALFEERKR